MVSHTFVIYTKMVVYSTAIIGTGALLLKYTTPTEEELIAKFSPELREQYYREKPLREERARLMKESLKVSLNSNRPIWQIAEFDVDKKKFIMPDKIDDLSNNSKIFELHPGPSNFSERLQYAFSGYDYDRSTDSPTEKKIIDTIQKIIKPVVPWIPYDQQVELAKEYKKKLDKAAAEAASSPSSKSDVLNKNNNNKSPVQVALEYDPLQESRTSRDSNDTQYKVAPSKISEDVRQQWLRKQKEETKLAAEKWSKNTRNQQINSYINDNDNKSNNDNPNSNNKPWWKFW